MTAIEDESEKISGFRRRRGGKQESQIIQDCLTTAPVEESEPKKPSHKQKISVFMLKVRKIIKQMADTAIKFFNETSMDYRHIADQLQVERKEKARTILEEPSRISSRAMSVPKPDQLAISDGIQPVSINVFL